jgi:integrase
MARKQPNGAGSLFRFRGGWRLQITIIGPDGEPQRITRSAKKQADLIAIRDRLVEEARAPKVVECTHTLSQWLCEWLEAGKSRWRRNTQAIHRHVVEHWIVGRGGDIRLSRLTIRDVRHLMEKVAADGAGVRTQQHVRSALVSALNLAVQESLIAANPALKVAKPKATRKPEIVPFTEQEVNEILAASRGHWFHAPIAFALTMGLRFGEIAGLRRQHVDIDRRTIRIEEQLVYLSGVHERTEPKTATSKRTLDMPEAAYRALVEHESIMLRKGMLAREELFPSAEGGPLNRTNFCARSWRKAVAAAGADPRGFHHTRHTFATLSLRRGVPLHVVARYLGHSSPEITLRVYAHWLPDDQRLAVDAINAITGDSSGCYHVATTDKRQTS